MVVAALFAMAMPLPAAARAQGDAPADSARVALRRALLSATAEVEAAELGLVQQAQGKRNLMDTADSARAMRHGAAVARLRVLLDSALHRTPWGGAELQLLRRAYPGSALLLRYEAAWHVHEGRDSLALAAYDALLRWAPDDAELLLARATVLERLRRPDDARGAYARALDARPEDGTAFDALVRLHARDSSLARLLEQVQRLRVRSPKSRLLADHEIELLHRMGRTAEAAEAARRLPEARS